MRIEQIAKEKGYYVSKDGILYNSKNNELGYINEAGYKVFKIRIKNKTKTLTVHRLQAYQKYGNKLFEEGIVVRHFDGNKLNNSSDNILIGTQSDNMMDIPEKIRIEKALYATSFVRKHNKQEIINFYTINKSYKETMKYFNISSKGTLHFILNK